MIEIAKELCNGDQEQAEIIVKEANYLELGSVS